MRSSDFERLPQTVWLLYTRFYGGNDVSFGVVRYIKSLAFRGVELDPKTETGLMWSSSIDELRLKLMASGIDQDCVFARTRFNNFAPPFIGAGSLDVCSVATYEGGS